MSISAVVPTYNRAAVLGRSLRSITRQTMPVDEIVVVDDASTDETARIVDELGIPDVTYVEHETNRGVAAARNTGLEHATGEFVLFLDSDDELHPEATETLYGVLARPGRDWGGAFTHYEQRNESGDLVEVWNATTGVVTKEDLTEWLAVDGVSGSMFRSSLLERVNGFDTRLPLSEDADLVYRLSDETDFFVVDEVLLTVHADNDNRLTGDDELYVTSQEAFLRKHGASISTRHRVRRHAKAGIAALRMGDDELASRHFDSSITAADDDAERAFALEYVGRLLANNGSARAAAVYFRGSLENDPTRLAVYPYLSLAFLGDGAWSAARRLKHRARLTWYRLERHKRSGTPRGGWSSGLDAVDRSLDR